MNIYFDYNMYSILNYNFVRKMYRCNKYSITAKYIKYMYNNYDLKIILNKI